MSARRPLEESSLNDVASRIRALVNEGCDFSFSDHAKKEMEKDGLTYPDVLRVLKSGKVTRRELTGGVWRYTVEGRAADGEWVAVVVWIGEEERRLKIFTVWLDKKR